MNEAVSQNWSTRALDRQIGTLYYERLLASQDRQPVREEAAENIAALAVTPRNFVRDPMLLEFLGLPNNEQIFASKYKLVLPTEEELRAELVREQILIASQSPR
jgi:predicted nuclease of restriction endonuclease-like (RecB) superfamily